MNNKYFIVAILIAVIALGVAIFSGKDEVIEKTIVQQVGGGSDVFTNFTDLQLGSGNKATSTTQGSLTQNDLTRLPVSGSCTASTTIFNFQNSFRATSTLDIGGGSIVEITNAGGSLAGLRIGTTSAASPTATGTAAFLNGQPLGNNSLLVATATTSAQASKTNLTIGPNDYIVGQLVRNGDSDDPEVQDFITNGSCDYSMTLIRDN